MRINTPNFRFFQRNKRQAALNLSKLAKEYAVQFLRINAITLNWKIYGKISEDKPLELSLFLMRPEQKTARG